jgi:type I restriction enzyme R subunit
LKNLVVLFLQVSVENQNRSHQNDSQNCNNWDMPPLTRKERAEQVKKQNYFTKYGEKARIVLEALLDKYADEGIVQIEQTQILTVSPFTNIGTPIEIIKAFGGLEQYNQAIYDLEQALYCA